MELSSMQEFDECLSKECSCVKELEKTYALSIIGAELEEKFDIAKRAVAIVVFTIPHFIPFLIIIYSRPLSLIVRANLKCDYW